MSVIGGWGKLGWGGLRVKGSKGSWDMRVYSSDLFIVFRYSVKTPGRSCASNKLAYGTGFSCKGHLRGMWLRFQFENLKFLFYGD